MNLEEMVAAIEQQNETKSPYVEPVKEKTIEELGSFEYSTERDDVGIRIQNPSFVKKNCKNCYGRGGVIQSFGGRRWQVCGCVLKGYQRHRRAHDENMAKMKRIEALVKKNDANIKAIDEIIAERQEQLNTAPPAETPPDGNKP